MVFGNIAEISMGLSIFALLAALVIFFIIRYSNKKLFGMVLEVLEELKKIEAHLKKFEKESAEGKQAMVGKIHSLESRMEKQKELRHDSRQKEAILIRH